MPEDQPVAVYYKEKRYAYMLRMSKYPYLEINAAAMDTLDSLISTYLNILLVLLRPFTRSFSVVLIDRTEAEAGRGVNG